MRGWEEKFIFFPFFLKTGKVKVGVCAFALLRGDPEAVWRKEQGS